MLYYCVCLFIVWVIFKGIKRGWTCYERIDPPPKMTYFYKLDMDYVCLGQQINIQKSEGVRV